MATMGWDLPEGWSAEVLDDKTSCMLITCPGTGYVTIDFDGRGFRIGISSTGRMDSTEAYSGRGWRQCLVADAVALLKDASRRTADQGKG